MKTKIFYGLMCIPILIMFAMARNVTADTSVSGIISSNTIWTLAGSPYIVTGSILVNNGVILTINPGVTVRFNSLKAMQVNGTLIAKGTSGNMIIFTSNLGIPVPGDWGYILFSDSSIDATFDVNGNYTSGCILEYCIVEYAGNSSYSAIRAESSSPFISHCYIRNNDNTGINVNETGTRIVSCSIYNNKDRGIRSTSSFIDNCTVYNNGGGIEATTSTITNCTIYSNNSGYGGSGILAGGSSISHCIIYNNKGGPGGGIYSANSTITNCIINNNTDGVCLEYGSSITKCIIYNNISCGISVAGTYAGNATISRNSIIGNKGTSHGVGLFITGGYHTTSGPSNITLNTIINNTLAGPSGSTIYITNNSTLKQNNIYSNYAPYELYNVYPQGSSDLDATQNWWGTSLDSDIQEKIYDWFDDSTKGIVDYSPFETHSGLESIPFSVEIL